MMDAHIQLYFVNTYQCVWLYKALETTPQTPAKYWLLITITVLLGLTQQYLKALKSNKNCVAHELFPPRNYQGKIGWVPPGAWKFFYKSVYVLINAQIMLLVMTFNTGIFAAVVVGQLLGYTKWCMKFDLRYTALKKCG
jgi:hypothetical protein